MNTNDLKRVNSLWVKIYPYLAKQVMENYGRDTGDVLELGPFAGGIARELEKSYPGLKITVANELHGEESRFDLIIFRGVFFFLNRKNLLKNIFRALKPGGMAFFGGGYGKGIPQALIDEIADESRILNDRLGRWQWSIAELREYIKKAGLTHNCRIEEEGGVWLVIRK